MYYFLWKCQGQNHLNIYNTHWLLHTYIMQFKVINLGSDTFGNPIVQKVLQN